MALYDHPRNRVTRWASFENLAALPGRAGRENRGAKGHAFDTLAPGESHTLLDVSGCGTVCRIWMTVRDRSPIWLRSIRIDMYWDEAVTPAVSAPLGDFFGVGLGRMAPFESALFASPAGRSFNCFVPMPFRTHARIVITNESSEHLSHLFYDIDLLQNVSHEVDAMYFHTHWRREAPNALGRDFELLPRITGAGRFLGCNVGVIPSLAYGDTWWGEGEFKAWLDGDDSLPTLCGSGAEDYFGTGWGIGAPFSHRTQGCPVVDKNGYAFYRLHIDDPIFFQHDCRAVMQTIGGGPLAAVRDLHAGGAALTPVTIDSGGAFVRLLDRPRPVDLSDPALPDGWCNFWRQDDWSSTAYFYLDRPENDLPALPPADARTSGLIATSNTAERADV